MILLIMMLACAPAQARQVVPNFTTGTVTSETTTRTEVTEVIRQQEYSTATTYTVTGTNINVPGTPTPGAGYTIVNQGAAFQFTETSFTPGLVTDTEINRTKITDSFTFSTSVFTQ